jgi:hypothetical protein
MDNLQEGGLAMPLLEAQFPPPLTKAQSAARRREDARMHDAHPGCYVAYLDEWDGDVLNRRMLLVARTPAELQEKMSAIAPALRRKLQLTLIPDAETIPFPEIGLR